MTLLPVDDEPRWTVYAALKRTDWTEYAPKIGEDAANTEIADRLAASTRGKCPPVRYWLAYAAGEPRGFFSSWEGLDGVGQVEDLFVLPEWRHRGVATALIHHCVADARSKGAGPVVIVCDPANTPKQMYAAMGWQPAAIARQYLRHLKN